jgi:ABC-type branched-subunit amino acid transport system ATPase component
MLAIGRGLLARPKVLLLDEPSLGLAPAVASELFKALARLSEEGTTLVIVDQMADQVLGIAGRGYLLSGGRVIAEGAAAELHGASLDEAYLGAYPGARN